MRVFNVIDSRSKFLLIWFIIKHFITIKNYF